MRPSLTQLYNELENLQVGAGAPRGRGIKGQTRGVDVWCTDNKGTGRADRGRLAN